MIHAIEILFLGAAAGWVAGMIMRYPSKNVLNTLIIGVLGSILGSYIFDFIEIEPKRLLGTFVMSLAGSCAVLWILKQIKMRF